MRRNNTRKEEDEEVIQERREMRNVLESKTIVIKICNLDRIQNLK